jgi:predicted negative regulator of RcsB-dependent stress response
MTSVPPDRRQAASIPESLADWFQLNRKYVVAGVGILAAAALGYWFVTASATRKAGQAEQQLLNARRSIMSGNAPLAQTDLKRIVDNFGNTRAGTEAALLLAESYYQERKFEAGIDVLEDFTSRGSAEYMRSKFISMIGDGRMELGKPAEAAADYARAADAARFEGDAAQQRAKQARALVVAGDSAKALELWEDLAESAAPGVAAEARVRVGELAAATKKS